MEQRLDAALLRHMLGEPALPGDERMVAMTLQAGGCHACRPPGA